jgi:hypothetical protein
MKTLLITSLIFISSFTHADVNNSNIASSAVTQELHTSQTAEHSSSSEKIQHMIRSYAQVIGLYQNQIEQESLAILAQREAELHQHFNSRLEQEFAANVDAALSAFNNRTL